MLVREDNHEVLAGEVLLQLVGQPLQCILIRDSTLAGGDDDKHVVFADGLGQPGQLVPVGHEGIVGPDGGMLVVDVFANEL